ncbi:MAG: aminotransferase class V-fold PLP-dependent enzyme [Rhodospirillaceae bacterium]|jgi:cysteine desulfurase / selenocysteine lyase|nr:aminotransferase class V-fold PLP-dependent enzyme [Rhodospirillaceae bacterium]
MTQRIYMDNSATSFPKPSAVTDAMVRFAEECGASAGRGAYDEARECGVMLQTARERIAELINAESPERIVFTMNCSEALNTAIRGVLNTSETPAHAIAIAMEHNSVLRPLNALAEQHGIEAEFVPCDPQTGLVDPDAIRAAIRPTTKLISCIHVSNVTGTAQPIQAVADIAAAAGIPCVIDVAQSIGHMEIDVQQLGADFVAFPGHKGLLGPLGTGVLYVKPGAEERCHTMKEGGTGTISELATHPLTMPDKYEIGSHNAIGIAGLLAGVEWILERGVDNLRRHDAELCELFLSATADIDGLTVYGPRDVADRTGVFSVTIAGLTCHQLADKLEADFGILTRPGIHCAPFAHQTIGTHPTGTCRLSFGAFTTHDHVQSAANALRQIVNS